MKVSLLFVGLMISVAALGSPLKDANALHKEAYQLKMKIESGAGLTVAEIARAEEITRLTGNQFDLEKAKPGAPEAEPVRQPSNPLDDYVWSTNTYEWVDITGVGTPAGIVSDDQNVGPFNLGFTFSYFTSSFSSIRMCSNGWISGTATSAQWTNSTLPNSAAPNDIICPFWDDLLPPSGEYYYYADAANQRFIASWINVPHIGTTNELYTFQVILYANGNIVFNYQNIFTGGTYGNSSCTVGIENSTGTEGVQVCYNNTGTLPTSGTSIIISQSDGVPSPVTNVVANVQGSDVNLTWTPPTTDTNGNPLTPESIQVWQGAAGNGTLLATLGGTATSYTHVNAPDGNILYSVRAYSNPFYGAPGTVVILVGSPSYAEDYEISEGLWESQDGGWQWGAMTNPNMFGAHSGSNVWATGLNANYGNSVCYLLDLDLGLAVESPTATVEFWASWDIEIPWDGTNFKVSTDGGSTWTRIPPISGYNNTNISTANVCIPAEQGWAGYDSTWRYIVIPIGQFVGEVPIFRFSFGTDLSVTAGGFAFDDMIIWGLQEPTTSTVSGTVSLDGGAGNITSVNVHANGLGNPMTHPAANGTYTLNNVLIGNRVVWADLTGYHDATTNVNLAESGATGINLTLVRLDPPVPTGLVGSVDNESGIMTLDWANSTDPLVDSYNIYLKLQTEQVWTLAANVPTSDATYQLPADGVYNVAVSAVDVNVSTPVESDMSAEITLLYGAIPPTGLTANGDYDDRISLFWFEPGTPPVLEVSYDEGTSETSIGWFTTGMNNWFTSRFAGSGEVIVNRISVLFTNQAIPGDAFSVGVFDDNNGVPGNLLAEIQSTHEAPFEVFREFELDEPVVIENGTFYVGVKQSSFNSVSIGGDLTASFMTNTFYYTLDQETWTTFEDGGWFAIPMIRCITSGDFNPAAEIKPSALNKSSQLFSMTSLAGTSWESSVSESKLQKSAAGTKAIGTKPLPNYVMHEEIPATSGRLGRNNVLELRRRANLAVAPHAPNQNPVSNRHPNQTLDDLDYYIVYRNGTDIAHPTTIPYFDTGRTENIDYTYAVAAHYDNGDVSSSAGPVTARCNMAPAAPTGLTGTGQGSSQMRLNWTNPTMNADNTPLVDHAGTRIFRNGTQIGEVGAGITQYIDTPPDPQQPYTWTVVAKDEVPNLSAASNAYQASVQSPWEVVDFEWNDISDIGTSAGITGDDQTAGPFNIGFNFTYFGNTFTQVWICGNGWITFTSTTSAAYFNTEIPDGVAPHNMVCVFWDDMYPPSGGQIMYHSDPANGTFTVSWLNIEHYFTTGEFYTYQIVLTEDGAIYFNYSDVDEGGQNGNMSCTVGVEDGTSSDAVQLCYNGTGSFIPVSNSAVAFWAGPSGEINGLVREFSTNAPIQDAEVSVEGGTDFALTDASGNYVLGVEPGTYTLNIHKQGYCDQSFANIVVQDGGTATQNANMRQPNIQLSVTSLNMIAAVNQNTSTSFIISNSTTNTICPLEYTITDNAAWLTCTPTEGSVLEGATIEITVNANVQGLPFGDYDAVISIAHNDNNSPSTVPVTLSISLDGEDAAVIPTQFAFHQNYPNPFNATTTLFFDLPNESRVDIAIYNVVGQEVARPVHAAYPAGSHAVSYTADGLPSGMYILRMTAGSFTGMHKMVLLK